MPAPWRYRKPGGKAANYYGVANRLTRKLKYNFVPKFGRACTILKAQIPGIAKAFGDIFGLTPVKIIKDGIEYKPDE